MQRIRERLQSSRQNAECVITRLTTHHLRQMKRAVAGVCMASLCDDEDDLLYIFIYGFIGVRYILFIYFCITSVRIVYSHPMQRKKITKKRAMVGRVRGHNGCVPRHLVTQRNQAVRSAPRSVAGDAARVGCAPTSVGRRRGPAEHLWQQVTGLRHSGTRNSGGRTTATGREKEGRGRVL